MDSIFSSLAGIGAVAATVYILRGKRQRKQEESAAAAAGSKDAGVFFDPNCPHDAAGRVHHLNVKKGEVAQRVLSVGDAGRAARFSTLLDGGSADLTIASSRGFTTYTGTYKGTPVSIVATGMGVPMMDFVVRETRVVVDGPMAMLRFGTCGGLRDTKAGSIVVSSEGSVLIRREPDAITAAVAAAGSDAGAGPAGGAAATGAAASVFSPSVASPYSVSAIVKPDAALSELYVRNAEAQMALLGDRAFPVVRGMHASADSFYSSQGRTNSFFVDNNEGLVDRVEEALPTLRAMEMESFHLLDMARSSKEGARIYASAAALALVNRHALTVVGREDFHVLEMLGGKAALETLVQFKL